MFRHNAEPQPQHEVGLKHQRQGDEQQDVERELGTLYEQPVHIGKVALRVALGELRIESHLEVGAELLADVLHLHGHGAGGVDSRPEEDVEQYVQPLRIADDGQVAVHGPARKGEYLAEQAAVVAGPSASLLEVARAI